MARVPAVARAFAARLPAWLDIVGERPEKDEKGKDGIDDAKME